jgi:hypothetical protein
MTPFEFVFTLFGLVLGLALAEVLGGFVRVLKARSVRADEDLRIRIGWQTPLLGLVVTLDLISFWLGAWEDRAAITVDFAPLVYSALIAGIYYAAASLVFPDEPRQWPDLDDWFERHKAQVALGIFAANLLVSFGEVLLFGTWSSSLPGRIFQVLYLGLALSLVFARRGRQSLVLLWAMVGVFTLLALRPAIIAVVG